MKSFAVLSALVALAAQVAAALTINTPSSLVTCEPSLISWTASTSPYFLTVFAGGSQTDALKTFTQTDSTSVTWNVDIASGTSVTLGIKDGTGATAFTSPVTISGSDSSCVNSSATESASGTGSAASGSSTDSSGSSASTTSGGSSSTGSSSGSSASGTSTSSSSSSSSSSPANRLTPASAGVIAGLLGFVGAAVL